MKRDLYYAVIGAGNGGLSMAGYLALKGFKVNLYNRTEEKIAHLRENPYIELTGEVEGTGKLIKVTSDMEEAIRGTDIIMITVPALGHYDIAKNMAPYVESGQIIVLNPGRTGGALEVYTTLKENGCDKDISVSEAQTFIYACRAIGPRSAQIFKTKKEVSLATIPSKKNAEVIELLSSAYPQFVPAKDVMETSLNNYGAIFHPAPTLLNSGHIERGQPFEYYTEGITPSISGLLEKMDDERMMIAKALDVYTVSAKDWLYESYGAKGDTLYESIQNNPGYWGLKAPKGLKIRYIYEDVPYSLVPMSSMAKQLGIETLAIDAIIRLANLITGRNFWEEGRNVEKLGIKDLSVKDIHRLAQTGLLTGENREVVA